MADLVHQGTVVRWSDGDTLTVNVALGAGLLPLALAAGVKVRLQSLTQGLDCPSAKTPEGQAATARAAALAPPGAAVVLHVHGHDEYGRALAAIITDAGVDVGAELLAEGHAVPWDGKGPHPQGGG